ncbi:MAG: PAS domain S-box protein [Thermodesulfobacteriota bacterium]
MEKSPQKKGLLRGISPLVYAHLFTGALICILLATNYHTQHRYQQTNLQQLQNNFENWVIGVDYFLSEREADFRDLAVSKPITSFFANRALGMTMTYGLQASLNNVTRLFSQLQNSSRIGDNPIYNSFNLLDKDGSVLTRQPAFGFAQWLPIPEADEMKEGQVIIHSHTSGAVSFTAPIFLHSGLQGFVQGWADYNSFISYLTGNKISGMLLIADQDPNLVFQSRSDEEVILEPLRPLIADGVSKTFELPRSSLLVSRDKNTSKTGELTLFYTQIPEYDIQFFLVEDSSAVFKRQSLFLFMGVLAALSLGVFLVSTSIYRAGTKNLLLRNSLTEAEKREKAVGKKRKELDAIIRNFLDTLIVVDNQLRVIRVNQATCKLLGYEEKELLHRPIATLFEDPSDMIDSIFSFYGEKDADVFNARGELRNVELSYRSKNGLCLPMSFNISIIQDDLGNISGVVAGAKEISTLKSAMDKLAGQKTYIENLFDVVPEGLLAISPSFTIVKHNRIFTEILREWTASFGVSEKSLTDELLTSLKQALDLTNQSVLSLNHNNKRGYFQYHGVTISSLEGINHVVSIRDITRKRMAEEARILLATVIEQTADAVIITDTGGITLYVNPAAVNNSGYREEELVGYLPSFFTEAFDELKQCKKLWKTISNGEVWYGRFSNRKKCGTLMEEDVTISPVRDNEDAITHYVAIKHDVTEMALLQRQLLQANKLEAIGQLAAGVAHEINTPMQYIQNNVTFFDQAFGELKQLLTDYQLLLEKPGITADDSCRLNLEEIDLEFLLTEIPQSIEESLGGIDRVVKIVSAMKEFSHPGSNEKIATDLNRALNNTITVSRNEWKYVAEIITDFDQDLPLVPCLPNQFNQATLNLIINGVHAIAETGALAPENPGRITIATRNRNDGVEIRISDSGIGIPEDIQDRIFDPFFTTKEVGRGTGQGLAIVHDIITRKHRGSIDFSSTPGKGTKFIIRLPLSDHHQGTTV